VAAGGRPRRGPPRYRRPERVYAPLTAGLLRPVAADAALPDHTRRQLDRLYQRIVIDLDALWRAIGSRAGA
jgi:hypothetical protein